MATLFESNPCSRCAGTGRYAHYGVCFKCGGSGVKLTRRGQAAQNYLNEMRRIPAESFVPGMLILAEGFTAGSLAVSSKFYTVTKVEVLKGRECGYAGSAADLDCVRVSAEGYSAVGFLGQTTYRRGFSDVEKAAMRADALAYQATLTLAGKPHKVR